MKFTRVPVAVTAAIRLLILVPSNGAREFFFAAYGDTSFVRRDIGRGNDLPRLVLQRIASSHVAGLFLRLEVVHAYVLVSRAGTDAQIYTNDGEGLKTKLGKDVSQRSAVAPNPSIEQVATGELGISV